MIKKKNNSIITNFKGAIPDAKPVCAEISPYITSPSFSYKPTPCLPL